MLADLRFSIRALFKNPAFCLAAILTIALGIGANSAMFSIVNGVLLKPLPYRDSSRIVRFEEGRPDFRLNISYPNFMDWRARNQVFEDMVIYNAFGTATLSGKDGAEVIPSGMTEPGLFAFLGTAPVLGRTFSPGEQSGIVISDRLWKRRFSGDPSIVGKTIVLNGEATAVLGVLPPGILIDSRDIWYPLVAQWLSPTQLDRGNHPGFRALARLKANVSFDQAQRSMTSIAQDLEKEHPDTNHRMGVMLKLLLDDVVGSVRPVLLVLFGAVAFVLLIACANVANLMLGRALGRGPEIAVRAALGAGRRRLLQLFVMEGLLLAAIGGILGLVAAVWAIDSLKIFAASAVPRISDIRLDAAVVAYTAVITLATALLFSIAPAWQAWHANVADGLKLAGRGVSSARQGLRWTLIAAEVALSVVLLTGAGLMIRSISNLARVDPGFRAGHLIAFNLTQASSGYSNPAAIQAFNENLAARLMTVPGVESVASSWPFDLISFGVTPRFQLVDKPVPAGREPSVQTAFVSPDYFRTMGIPLLRGRGFSALDGKDSPPVAIVSDSFARSYYPNESPIGKRINLVGWSFSRPLEIVGVVGNTLRGGLDSHPYPELYGCDRQMVFQGGSILLRSKGDPLQLTNTIRRTIAAIDPDVAMESPVRVEDAMWNTVANRRFTRYQLMVFAGLALLLAAAGIYGVVSYSIGQRTREIGIRMALGAVRIDVIALVLRRTARPVLIGLALGTASAAVLTRYIASQLYGVRTFDPVTLAAVCAVILLAAVAAAWGPMRRASRLDPLTALRAE